MTPAQAMYDWMFARGWGRVAIEMLNWNGADFDSWQVMSHSDDRPPVQLASGRGPLEGIMEEMIALERAYPDWVGQAKRESREALEKMHRGR
jgi:hypothetical protein